MRFVIPVTVEVDAPNADAAQTQAQTVRKLLGQSLVQMTLKSSGVGVVQLTVGNASELRR